MTRRSLARGTGLAVALTLFLAACSAGSTPVPASAGVSPSVATSASAGASAAGTGSTVTIQGFAFGPASLTVPAGTTVTWTNKDSVEHTVTADDGSFGSQPIPTGQAFSQTFSTAGTFSYHCKIHPSMTATITVH